MLYSPTWGGGRKFEGEAVNFALWYIHTRNFQDFPPLAPDTLKEVAGALGKTGSRLLKITEEIQAPLPPFDNFPKAISLCDQFLEGRIDPVLLTEVKDRSKIDLDAAAPFIVKFAADMGFSSAKHFEDMPVVLLVFSYPASLMDYIQKNSDAEGLVTGLSPIQRNDIKKFIERGSEQLKRPHSPSPG